MTRLVVLCLLRRMVRASVTRVRIPYPTHARAPFRSARRTRTGCSSCDPQLKSCSVWRFPAHERRQIWEGAGSRLRPSPAGCARIRLRAQVSAHPDGVASTPAAPTVVKLDNNLSAEEYMLES